MDFNPPSTADFANATANDANALGKDHAVILAWLQGRLDAIEETLGIIPPECPITPSQQIAINRAKARAWYASPEGRETVRKYGEEYQRRRGEYPRSILGHP